MNNLSDHENKIESVAFLLGIILLAIGYLVLKYSFGILISDDAYITLSHVKTWFNHGRVVMSMQNPVNATSTPLLTLLLGFLTLITGIDYITFTAFYTSSFFEILSLILVYLIARSLNIPTPIALLSVSAFGLSVGFYASSAYGMETTLYIFLILLAHYVVLFHPNRTALLCSALFCVTLVRPEGVLVASAIILIRLICRERKRVLLGYCAITVAALLTFFLFYYISYGNVLPHSVVAKQSQVDFGLKEAFSAWVAHVFYKGPVFGGRRTILFINIVVSLLGLAGFYFIRDRSSIFQLLPWPIFYVLFFIVTRSSDPLMPWYFFPVMPFLIVLLIFGIFALLSRLSLKPLILWVFVVLFQIFCFTNMFIQKVPDNFKGAEEVREQRYQVALQSIKNVADSADVIMIDEVGTIGFYGHYKVLDSHGLLSPEVLPLWKMCNNYHELNKLLVTKFNPDWVFYTRHINYITHRYSEGESGLFGKYTLFKSLSKEGNPFLLELWKRQS